MSRIEGIFTMSAPAKLTSPSEPCTGNVITDPEAIEPRRTSSYPARYQIPPGKRGRRSLGGAFGLTNFGVNLTVLEPGGWSSQRHWHAKQDELIYVLDGEVTLVTDDGEMVLTAGMTAGFKAGVANGHHLINRTDRPATYLEVGGHTATEVVTYSDIDMVLREGADGTRQFLDKQGRPY